MHSPPAPERRWSLTSRLARRFTLVTSVLIALYALGSSWVVFHTQGRELEKLMDHESRELLVEVQESDGSTGAIRRIAQETESLFQRPPCATRMLAADGSMLATSGFANLLEIAAVRTTPAGARPGLPLAGDSVIVWSMQDAVHDVTIEFIVDASAERNAFYTYVLWSTVALLVSIVLAALCGLYTARRGLVGLHALVAQARAISLPSGGPALRLEDAPEELAELGLELNAMLGRIREGLTSMRTFTASLAHELRSPLQNLIGETEVTLLSERDGEEYRRLLRSNLDDLHDLSDAIDNLVAFCRTAEPASSQPALRERFDLAAEGRLRLERERRTGKRNGVEMSFESSGDTTLFADREAGLRVLRNLVSNAIAASPAGSSVDVRISGLPDRVRIEVDDQGPGIPPELGDRIFEPFVTGRPRRGQRGGYGLGLAICRSVMRDHAGQLRHEPRRAGGTRFIAEFPRSTPTPAPVAATL